MNNTILAIGLSACLFGCTRSDPLIVSLKDEACACKDRACGDEVGKKINEVMVQFDKDFEKNPNDPNAAAALAAMYEATQCLQKLM